MQMTRHRMAWQRCALQIGYVMYADIIDTLPYRSITCERTMLTEASAHVRLIHFWRVATHSRPRMSTLRPTGACDVPDEVTGRGVYRDPRQGPCLNGESRPQSGENRCLRRHARSTEQEKREPSWLHRRDKGKNLCPLGPPPVVT